MVRRSGDKWIWLQCSSKYNINPWCALKYQVSTLFLPRYEITKAMWNSDLLCIWGADNSQAAQPRITLEVFGGKKCGYGAHQTCRFWNCIWSSKPNSWQAFHGWFSAMVFYGTGSALPRAVVLLPATPHIPVRAAKIASTIKAASTFQILWEKYENMNILVGSGWLRWRGGCWCSSTGGSPNTTLAGHAAMKAPFISRWWTL